VGISVGMVGMGGFGREFVPLFRDHPDVSRLAICDVDAQRLAEIGDRHGLSERYPTLEALLASDIQAIVLITQPWLHQAQAVAALRAGKHVYSAVPAAFGFEATAILDQLDMLVRTVQETGLIYMMGETTYFRPEVVYCRQRAAAGDFGEFTYAECEYWHDLDSPTSNLRQVYYRRWGKDWGQDKRGGIPMFYPTHALGGVVSVMGTRMVSVSARGYRYPNDDWFVRETIEGNEFSNEVALYQAANGALVRHSEFRRIGHPNREGVRIFGTEGCFLDDPSGCRWTTRQGWEPVDLAGVREPLPEPLAANLGGHGGSHAYLVHEFVDSCARGRQPRVNVWQAARYLAPGIVAHQSALRDGEPLPIPDWGDGPAA